MSRSLNWRRMREQLSKERNMTVFDLIRKTNRSHKRHVSKLHKQPKHKGLLKIVE